MDLFVIAFLIIIIIGIKPMKHNEQYIGFNSTTAIKGIFAIIILFSHSRQYAPSSVTYWGGHSYTILYNSILDFFGQLMVVMFLTYSGYGIMESYKRKGKSYLNGFCKKRVLKTLIHFDIAVLLFLILSLILGHEYSLKQYILSFIGWEDIGNSNWFIFDIIVLYLLSYFGLYFTAKFNLNTKAFLLIISFLSLGFLVFMYKAKPGFLWWCDTILAFPIGMIWSEFKNRINQFFRKQTTYIMTLFAVICLFGMFYILGHNFKVIFSFVNAPIFAILVILITMRFKIGNSVLYWLGINAFAIYILQRIPMIIASEFGLHYSPELFMLVIIPSTLVIAWAFTGFTKRIDNKLFS